MPIAMTDGTTYENSLDMLFAKDMPSREETNRQQEDKRMKEHMDALDSTMPPDMRGPPSPEEDQRRKEQERAYATRPPTEEEQLHPQSKDQSSPYEWGMGESMDRTGPAMVPWPEPKFHEIMDHMDYLIDPEGALPANARPTNAEFITTPSASEAPPEQSKQEGDKSSYQNFTDKLEELSKTLNPSFIPTAEQFRDAPWKEKLGFILASSFMFAGPGRGPINKGAVRENVPTSASDPLRFWQEGLAEYDKVEHPVINTLRMAEKEGSQTATNLLETYRKIDDPVVRAEFSKIVKDKISAAAEGGETSPSNITNPEIKRWTPEEDTALKDVAKSGKIDFENLPPELEGRSVGSLLNRARDLKVIEPSARYVRQPGDSEGYGPRESKYQDKFPDIIKSIKEGKTYADIARDIEMKPESLRQLIKSRPELRSVYDETNPTPKGNTPWTPAEIKALRTWHADPDNDLFEPPAMLKHRSPGAIDTMIEKLKLNKEADAAPSSKPFVPQGAVRAPETGGGSGGPRETELTGKSGITTPNTIPEDAANSNKVNPGQIETPGMDAALDKMWKNMGVALEKGIAPISPVLEAKMNPVGRKNLKQFETEMDYKYKDENRGWISQLNDKEVEKYKALIDRSTFRNENNIKSRIQRMYEFPKEPDIQKQDLGSPREKAIREKNSTYPTTEDAYAARAYDQFHGEDVDAYAKGKVARILGSVDKTGKVIPKSGITDDLTEFMKGIMKESVSKNVDLTKKENWKYADDLANEFTKTAIVAKRVPIAALGFDPSRIVNDVKLNDMGLRSTIGGAYMGPGHEGNKGSDAIYSNNQGAGTMVHESIHRGLEKLRDRPDLRGAFANLPADEESLVRYIMYKHAGDPEGEAGSVDAKQRRDAITRFEGTDGKTYARYAEAINKITKAAQDEIKKRRPGGHR